MTDEKCPCIDCICIPMCRHKHYLTVFMECSIAREYEPQYAAINRRNRDRLIQVQRELNSTRWGVLAQEQGGEGLVYIDSHILSN